MSENQTPKIFIVTQSPESLCLHDPSVLPKNIKERVSAVVNVADEPSLTFEYMNAGVPSFWFPINEYSKWGYSPFYGTLNVVKNYYTINGKPILIHCHAGANRSPSIAFAVLKAIGYTDKEIEEALEYPNLRLVFQKNIRRCYIPKDIVNFLKECLNYPEFTMAASLNKMGLLKQEMEQCNWFIDNSLIYDEEKMKFVLNKEEL